MLLQFLAGERGQLPDRGVVLGVEVRLAAQHVLGNFHLVQMRPPAKGLLAGVGEELAKLARTGELRALHQLVQFAAEQFELLTGPGDRFHRVNPYTL